MNQSSQGHTTRNLELLLFSIPTTVAGLFGGLLLWVDRFLIGYFLPAVDVGLYQASAQLSLLFTIILGSINVIFSPMIARLYHQNERKRLEKLYKISTKWGLYIGLPLAMVIFFVPRQLISITYGIEYASGNILMVILSTAQLINLGTGAVGFILIMTGQQNRWMTISAVALISNIGLNLWLIPKYALLGAAIGTSISIGGLYLIGLWQVWHSLRLTPFDRRYQKGILAVLVTLATLTIFPIHLIQSSSVAVISTLGIATASFGATLIILGIDSEDKEFIRIVISRMRSVERG